METPSTRASLERLPAGLERLPTLRGAAPLLEWGLDLRVVPADATELLVSHALRLFHVSGVAEAFALPADALLGAVLELRDAYMPNPFHNWRHAIMVMHKVTRIHVHATHVACAFTDACMVLHKAMCRTYS